MEQITVSLTREKDCKHSVRYGTKDPDAKIRNVYVNRAAFGGEAPPQAVEVTARAV